LGCCGCIALDTLRQFQQVQQAYEILRDATTRREYDQWRHNAAGTGISFAKWKELNMAATVHWHMPPSTACLTEQPHTPTTTPATTTTTTTRGASYATSNLPTEYEQVPTSNAWRWGTSGGNVSLQRQWRAYQV
jgi:curved DNA-binding protein CbpA